MLFFQIMIYNFFNSKIRNSCKVSMFCCCWQWNFRIGFTPREGLVIYSVAYVDGSRGRRPVAHRLSFVEMVVPYGDPNDPHYRKNAFDAGEDGLGKNAHSLKKVWSCYLLHLFILCDILLFSLVELDWYETFTMILRDVTVWDISNTLTPTLPTSLEVLKRLKIVYVCMKRTMDFCGSIKIGEQA